MNLFELLFLVMRLPFAALGYGIGALGRILGDLQQITDGGWGLLESGEYEPAGPECSFSAPSPVPELAWPQRPLPLLSEPSSFVGHAVPQEPTKEDRRMDQDLSGDMVKVVQYSIVSVVTAAGGGALVLSTKRGTPSDPVTGAPPERPLGEVNVIAFSDDMTGEDFTSWIMSIHSEEIDEALKHLPRRAGIWDPGVRGRKFLRVAFSVIGRFAPADINYEELQAGAVANLAQTTNQLSRFLEEKIDSTIDEKLQAVRTHEVKNPPNG